jgi:hypothetical protein
VGTCFLYHDVPAMNCSKAATIYCIVSHGEIERSMEIEWFTNYYILVDNHARCYGKSNTQFKIKLNII